MKSIIAAIARFLRAMPRFIIERVHVAGRWLERLVAVPSPYEPDAPEQEAAASDDWDTEHMQGVRTAAAHIAAGQVPPEMAVNYLEELDFAWLAAMPRSMLCKIVGAPDEALLAHIKGKRPLRGVLARDRNAVDDFRAETRRERRQQDLEHGLELGIA